MKVKYYLPQYTFHISNSIDEYLCSIIFPSVNVNSLYKKMTQSLIPRYLIQQGRFGKFFEKVKVNYLSSFWELWCDSVNTRPLPKVPFIILHYENVNYYNNSYKVILEKIYYSVVRLLKLSFKIFHISVLQLFKYVYSMLLLFVAVNLWVYMLLLILHFRIT